MTQPIGWRITWGERTWTDDDVLGADLAAVQLLIGGGWENMDPTAGPLQLMAWIAALEMRSTGRDAADVLAEVRLTPGSELLDAITGRMPESA